MSSAISIWVELSDADGLFRAVLADGSPPDPEAHPLEVDWPDQLTYVEFALLGQTSRRPVIKPLVTPRGIPDDTYPPVKAWILDYPMVAASWLTASELQNFDWTALIPFRTDLNMLFQPDGLSRLGLDRPHNRIVDVHGRIINGPSGNLLHGHQGAEDSESEWYPDVVEVPLIHAAPGLHKLMESTVALRPDGTDTVRIIYAFDQY